MSEYYDDQTIGKVYASLASAGITRTTAIELINAMQNHGILFRERGETIEDQLRKTAPQSYRDALRRPLLDRGFGPLDGIHFRHPSGVEVQMWAEGVRMRYPADWADSDCDLQAVFDLAYGTNFDVIIDLAEALIAKIDADRDDKDPPRGEVRGPGV